MAPRCWPHGTRPMEPRRSTCWPDLGPRATRPDRGGSAGRERRLVGLGQVVKSPLTFKRPSDPFFHREAMPDEIELHVYEPPGAEETYGPGGFAGEVARQLAEKERRVQLERGVPERDVRVSGDDRPRRAGSMRRFFGADNVKAASPFDTFPMPKKKCYLREVLCGSPEVLKHELALIAEFRIDYREARKELLAGHDPVFPAGTYALRRWAGVKVAKAPPPVDYDEIEHLAAA